MIDRPCIVIACEPESNQGLLAGMHHGCEEEGVPVAIVQEPGSATNLARLAASRSPLFIGLGLDQAGTIVLVEHRAADRAPLLHVSTASTANARLLGVAAGRIARRRPLPVDQGMSTGH